MKIKTLPIGQVKAGPEDGLADGQFLVYPSTFTRKRDAYGEVVAKGHFSKILPVGRSRGTRCPGCMGIGWTTRTTSWRPPWSRAKTSMVGG